MLMGQKKHCLISYMQVSRFQAIFKKYREFFIKCHNIVCPSSLGGYPTEDGMQIWQIHPKESGVE